MYCYIDDPLIQGHDSISLIPAFPGLRRFPEGRDFQQWTGDDSKALMKVRLIALLRNHPYSFFIRYISPQLLDTSHQTWSNAFQHLWTSVTLYAVMALQAMPSMKLRTNLHNSIITVTFLLAQASALIYLCHVNMHLSTTLAPSVFMALLMAYALQ